MKTPRIEKVTVNIGVGAESENVEKAEELLNRITEQKPVKTEAKAKAPVWGIRPGKEVGAKVTLRGKKAKNFLERAFKAVENKIKKKSIDENGNFSFGVDEYIDLPDMDYDHNIGMMGMDVCVTMEKPGYRIKKRKRKQKKVHDKLTPEETAEWLEKKFNIEVIQNEEEA